MTIRDLVDRDSPVRKQIYLIFDHTQDQEEDLQLAKTQTTTQIGLNRTN